MWGIDKVTLDHTEAGAPGQGREVPHFCLTPEIQSDVVGGDLHFRLALQGT